VNILDSILIVGTVFLLVHLQGCHTQDHLCRHGYAKGPRKESRKNLTMRNRHEIEHIEGETRYLVSRYANLDDAVGVH